MPCDIGVRPNSPPQMTSVSSSMPRCFRSLISARGRPVDFFRLAARCPFLTLLVMVPVAVVELDEAHAALGQPPRQQAVRGERAVARLRAVHLQHVLRLLAHVHQVGHAGLHLERHLVLRDARQDLGILQPSDTRCAFSALMASMESLLHAACRCPAGLSM